MEALHLKDLHLQDQCVAVVWEEELLCHVEETVMVVLHAENRCHHEEMSTCLQEMMATALKTVTQAEIIPVPGIQGTMRHLHGTTHIVITVIPVHVMNTPRGAIVFPLTVIVTDTVVDVTETTQIIQVEDPTEIHMRVMVTHVVLHLHEGPRHLMVEAVDMMITAAHVMDMEAEKVTQAAEVMSTQVAVIVLEDKTGVFPHPWKGAIHRLVIHTVVQAAEHPEVVAVEEADLTEVEAEADTKNTLKFFWTKINFANKSGSCSIFTTRGLLKGKVVFTFFYCCLLSFPLHDFYAFVKKS